MSGIGEALRSERRRQGRTLADAAAETRVRESYLAAIEGEDFDVLGGDVYSRGFIRLYGKYLGLDAEELVRLFRAHHERPAEVTAIPGATIDEIMPMRGMPRMASNPPILAGVGVVLVLVVLFLAFRGGGEDAVTAPDPDAPGPSPAAAAATEASEGSEAAVVDAATEGDSSLAPAPGASAGAPAAGVLTEVLVEVTALAPVQLSVSRGQPPVSGATLDPGESRTLTDPEGQQVVFTVSDMAGVTILLNGEVLAAPELAGRAVEISCTVGREGCDATPQ